jgi:hypothetical protein
MARIFPWEDDRGYGAVVEVGVSNGGAVGFGVSDGISLGIGVSDGASLGVGAKVAVASLVAVAGGVTGVLVAEAAAVTGGVGVFVPIPGRDVGVRVGALMAVPVRLGVAVGPDEMWVAVGAAVLGGAWPVELGGAVAGKGVEVVACVPGASVVPAPAGRSMVMVSR